MSKPSEEAKNIWGKIAHDAVSGVPAGKCMQEGALAIDALVQRAVERERERCAKIAEAKAKEERQAESFGIESSGQDAASEIAAALRATPNTGG